MASPDAIDGFLARWQDVTASELATHDDLTLTGLYNVLVKVPGGTHRAGAGVLCMPGIPHRGPATALTAKEKVIHEKGLVAVLKQFHDQLAAVAKLLADSPAAQTEAQLAANFTGKGRWKSRLPDILAALEALGRARTTSGGWVAG